VWEDVSFLLTGDIEAAGERALLDSNVPLQSTVLKVAHHGSATSSTRSFLDAVLPSIAVISSGEGNPFGHPDDEVIARLAQYAPVFDAADHGSVRFETDGHQLWIETDR
jgi:competence protein ComEC